MWYGLCISLEKDRFWDVEVPDVLDSDELITSFLFVTLPRVDLPTEPSPVFCLTHANTWDLSVGTSLVSAMTSEPSWDKNAQINSENSTYIMELLFKRDLLMVTSQCSVQEAQRGTYTYFLIAPSHHWRSTSDDHLSHHNCQKKSFRYNKFSEFIWEKKKTVMNWAALRNRRGSESSAAAHG